MVEHYLLASKESNKSYFWPGFIYIFIYRKQQQKNGQVSLSTGQTYVVGKKIIVHYISQAESIK